MISIFEINDKLFISKIFLLFQKPVNFESNLFTLVYRWTARFFRPFLRRLRIVFRPCAVAMRVRKPASFKIEYRLLFESVFFDI